MAKLYFKYGAMGCSKTAQALITKFNYEERGMKVMFLKPAVDTRDGADVARSRIGLEAPVISIPQDTDIYNLYQSEHSDCQVIIVDLDIPVLCFGLRTDFLTHLFPGSRRLFEIAESITEIKSICRCGSKASVNARIDDNGNVMFDGDQICLGGNDRYVPMCRKCWEKHRKAQKNVGEKS